MKELFRAKEIHQEITSLDKQVVKLEQNLDLIIKEKSNGSISLKINAEKEAKLKFDENGSLVDEDDCSQSFMFRMVNGRFEDHNKKYEKDFTCDLSESELILMFATLLRHKQEKRNSLIKEFNGLSIKLKI